MLTQTDLQAIGKIIDEKLSPLETKLTKKISAQGKKTDRGFKSVDKKLDIIINYFDHENIIKLHLGLAPLNS